MLVSVVWFVGIPLFYLVMSVEGHNTWVHTCDVLPQMSLFTTMSLLCGALSSPGLTYRVCWIQRGVECMMKNVCVLVE